MNTHKVFILLLFAAAQILAAQSPDLAQRQEAESAALARLERATLMLGDSEVSNRLAAVHQLINLAGPRSISPDEVERLLLRATADPDPEIALLATRAVDSLDQTAEPAVGSDDDVGAHADARRLAWLVEAFARPEAAVQNEPSRMAAMQTLIHLASGDRRWNRDLEWLVERARQDTDIEVAYLAERLLARHEGRAPDPRFATRTAPSQQGHGQPSEGDQRADARYAATDHPNPDTRLASLHWVTDIALSEGVESDPRILSALIAHFEDPDPRIAHFVRLALVDLGGSETLLTRIDSGRWNPRAVSYALSEGAAR